MSKIDEFKEYARRRIVERMRDERTEKANEDKNEKSGEIRSYDGENSFYSGSDEEYREFLDELDEKDGAESDPEPVENTRRINLGDAIKARGVFDKVKETAESLAGAAAEKAGETITRLKARSTDEEDSGETRFEKPEGDSSADMVKAVIEDTMSEMTDSVRKIDGIGEQLEDVSDGFGSISAELAEIKQGVLALEKRIQELEVKNSDTVESFSAGTADIKHEMSELRAMTENIRDAVNGVSKLNDSVFDMKNSQQNTKNALNELQTAFARLKKKTVTGIVVLSIIGFIVAALEVINLLA